MADISMADIFRKQNIDNGYVSIRVGSLYTYSTSDMAVHIREDDESALSPSELSITLCGIQLTRGTHYTVGSLTENWPTFTAPVTGIGGGISGSATIKYIADL